MDFIIKLDVCYFRVSVALAAEAGRSHIPLLTVVLNIQSFNNIKV